MGRLAASMTELVVSEVFGPTVQGEGPFTGRRCAFVRLGRCNLDCRWCDTPYTWDWSGKNGVAYDPAVELGRRSVEAVAEGLVELGVPLVVVSGGEPLIQGRAVTELCRRLERAGVATHIETNGTQPPCYTATYHVVSPKLGGSGVSRQLAIDLPRLAEFTELAVEGLAAFKFVVCSLEDCAEVEALVGQLGIPRGSVWIMPEARSAADLERPWTVEAAEWAIGQGFNVSGRLHVALWGARRGV